MANHDLETHPWLNEFDKKSDKQKMDTVINQIKYLESLVGTISIILISFICVFVVLAGMSVVFGSVSISSLISLIK
jgi:uncharacterized Tic20 family protein